MAVRAPPTCKKPVGEGAKRTRMGPWMAGGISGQSITAIGTDPADGIAPGVVRAAGPLTSPNPSSRTARPTAGRGGAFKNKSKSVSLLAREGGCEVGEEGRGGEGPRRRGIAPLQEDIGIGV